MTGTNHALTGAAIGIALQEPLLIVPLAFASHFVLDAIPHFDHEIYRFGSRWATRLYVIDGMLATLGLGLLIVLLSQLWFYILLGAFFGVAPDIFWLYYYRHGRPQHWYFRFHSWIQWFERPPGLLVEASYLVFISTALYALF